MNGAFRILNSVAGQEAYGAPAVRNLRSKLSFYALNWVPLSAVSILEIQYLNFRL